jgi:serine/threonine protein phosphatase 1
MLRRLLGLAPRPSDRARVPDGTVVYAVGDIHGNAGLLDRLHGQIRQDAERLDARRRVLVHVGDYVDRGPESREVLEILSSDPPAGFETVNLLGNHDSWFLSALEDAGQVPPWLEHGGRATAFSYGVAPDPALDLDARAEQVRAELAERVPVRHVAWLRGTALSHREGDYLFVHAGIRPGVPLARQRPEDMLWVRDDFLRARRDHGCVVVHGHTPVETPEVHRNRIAIDTAAYATGRLTAAVLHGRSRRFLATA